MKVPTYPTWWKGLLRALLALAAAAGPAVATTLPPSPLRATLEAELTRTLQELKTTPAPLYFLGYAVYEVELTRIAAAFGVLTESSRTRRRLLTIDLRVGDYTLDNTHLVRGDVFGRLASRLREPVELPLEDNPAALRALIWRATDRRYRDAVETLAQVKTRQQLTVAEEDQSGDFSVEEPVTDWEPPASLAMDVPSWEARLKRGSAVFASDPLLLDGHATLEAGTVRRTLVTSEGTRLETSQAGARLAIAGMTKAADGMELPRYETFFAFRLEDLPSEERVRAGARSIVADLAALRAAPTLDPYTGPAILSGRSAGVFVHEVLGHRIEGHRQKDEHEAQTFKQMVGQQVLPAFLSVLFDPTRRTVGQTPAAGYYRYDDEGVTARAVYAVEKGVLKSFLMSRSPVAGFPQSNGHGRSQPGLAPVGRQSNLVVEAAQPVPPRRLRELLLEEVKRQGKPFGLVFADIAGGFTFTGRALPNAFTILPVMVWRVYADGRPDDLVRGADLIGTPLTAFSKILAAGDDLATFNGLCGAESGSVPVSASSPSLLLEQIEVQKQVKAADRPPILPAPAVTPAPQTDPTQVGHRRAESRAERPR